MAAARGLLSFHERGERPAELLRIPDTGAERHLLNALQGVLDAASTAIARDARLVRECKGLRLAIDVGLGVRGAEAYLPQNGKQRSSAERQWQYVVELGEEGNEYRCKEPHAYCEDDPHGDPGCDRHSVLVLYMSRKHMVKVQYGHRHDATMSRQFLPGNPTELPCFEACGGEVTVDIREADYNLLWRPSTWSKWVGSAAPVSSEEPSGELFFEDETCNTVRLADSQLIFNFWLDKIVCRIKSHAITRTYFLLRYVDGNGERREKQISIVGRDQAQLLTVKKAILDQHADALIFPINEKEWFHLMTSIMQRSDCTTKHLVEHMGWCGEHFLTADGVLCAGTFTPYAQTGFHLDEDYLLNKSIPIPRQNYIHYQHEEDCVARMHNTCSYVMDVLTYHEENRNSVLMLMGTCIASLYYNNGIFKERRQFPNTLCMSDGGSTGKTTSVGHAAALIGLSDYRCNNVTTAAMNMIASIHQGGVVLYDDIAEEKKLGDLFKQLYDQTHRSNCSRQTKPTMAVIFTANFLPLDSKNKASAQRLNILEYGAYQHDKPNKTQLEHAIFQRRQSLTSLVDFIRFDEDDMRAGVLELMAYVTTVIKKVCANNMQGGEDRVAFNVGSIAYFGLQLLYYCRNAAEHVLWFMPVVQSFFADYLCTTVPNILVDKQANQRPLDNFYSSLHEATQRNGSGSQRHSLWL